MARAAMAQLLEVRSSLTQVEERINRLPAPEVVSQGIERAEQVRRQLTQISDEAEEKRTAWVRDLQDARTKREGLLDQYKDLKEQQQRITAAGAEGICPTLRPSARQGIRKRSRHAGPPTAGRALQRQLLQAAYRTAGERAAGAGGS